MKMLIETQQMGYTIYEGEHWPREITQNVA